MAQFLTDPVPHTEGADFLRNKPAVTRAIFDALAPELQAKAFMITGVEALDVVARVRDLAAQLPEGGDYEELKGKIIDELSPWLVTSTDPEEQGKQINAARRRAELLLRMHGWQAYARTQDAMIRRNIDVFPYCEYLDSGDGRVRETHHALNGKIIPTDHPFWLTHTPPWEFGCRCDKVGRTQEDVDQIRDGEKHLPLEERRVLNDYQISQLEDGQLFTRTKKGFLGWIDVRTPRERNGGDGYEWRVTEDALSIDQILARFTDAERKAFEGFAAKQKLEDGRTLLEWWKPTATAPAPAPGPAPAKPTPVVTPPAPAIKPVSAALDVKARSGAVIKEAIRIIDSVHGDGVLPQIPVKGDPSPSAAGSFHAFSNGKVEQIKVRVTGAWPRMTTAHEVGHFLDHSGMGIPGKWESQTPGPLADIVAALQKTSTWQRIRAEAGPNTAYYERARETWARAYAQFIAVQSGDAEMLRELDKIRTSIAPWRQWPDVEFEPIRKMIVAFFQSLKWM